MSTPDRARAAAERLSAPHRPVPAPIFERRGRAEVAERAPDNEEDVYERRTPVYPYAPPPQSRGFVSEVLIPLVACIVFIACGLVAAPYVYSYFGAPAQTITTTTRPQVAPAAPRSVPAVAPERPQERPYDNAAYNATADALRGAQEAQPVEAAPPADVPTLVPEWHAPLALPADGVPSACATWHAPLPYPQECAAWHAPLVTP